MTDDIQFRELMESLNTGIVVIQEEKIVYVNSYLSEKFGVPKSKLVGKSLLEFIPPSNHQQIKIKFLDLLYSSKETKNFVTQIINAKGITRTVKLNSAPTSFKGKVARILSLQDITDQRKSEKLLSEVGDIAKIGGWEMNLIDRTAKWTKATYDIVELDLDAPVPGPDEHIDYYLPKYRSMIKGLMDDLINEGKELDFEAELKTAKGNIKWCRAIGQPLEYDISGKCIKIQGVFQDITMQKQAVQTMVRNEEKFRSFFNDSLVGAFISTPQGKLLDCNQAFINMMGYPDKNTALSTNTKKLYKKNIDRQSKIEQLIDHNKIFQHEEELIRFDGKKIKALSNIWGEYDVDGNLKYLQGFTQDITVQKQVENDLIEQKLFLESLLNSSSNIIYIYDLVKKENVYSNNTVGQILGYSVQEIQSFDNLVQDLMHPEDFTNYIKNIIPLYQSAKDGELIEHEYRIHHKDGEWCWLLSKESIYRRDSKGNATQIFGVISDITEQKRAQDALHQTQQQLTTLISSYPDFIVRFDRQCRHLYVSPSVLRAFNIREEKIVGKTLNEVPFAGSPEQIKTLEKAIKETFDSKQPTVLEIIWKIDKGYRTFEVRHIPELDTNGKVVSVIGITRDITKHKFYEKLLEEKERQMQAIYNDPNMFIGVLDLDGKVLDANKSALNFIGKTLSDVGGVEFWDTPWWTHSPKLQSILKDSFKKAKKGNATTFQADHRGENGELVYVEFSIRPIKDKKSNIYGFLVEGLNNTDKILAEKELKESEQKFRSVLEDIDLIGVMINDEANIIFANDHLLKKTGWKRKEIIGKNWFEVFIDEAVREKSKHNFFKTINSKKVFSNRTNEILTKDGKKLIVKWNVTPHYDADENLISATSIGEDVTKQRQIEADLRFQSDLIKQSFESIITTDTNFRISWVNNAFEKLFGYSKNEVLGKTPDFLNADPLSDEIQADIYKTVSNGELYQNTLQNVKKDGSKFYCQMSIFPIFDEKKNIIAYSGHQLDITDEINSQHKLAESEERYRDLFENQIEGYAYHEIILDKNGKPADYRYIDVNDQFLKELGYKKKSDVIGKTILELVPNIDKKWIDTYGAIAVTGKPKRFEDYFSEMDKYFSISAYSPKIGFFATSFIDITEEKNAELELKHSKDYYQDLFEENKAIKLIIDPETGEILEANGAAYDFYGYKKGVLEKMRITDINQLSNKEVLAEMARAKSRNRTYFNFRHKLATGEIRDVEVYSGPVNRDGKTVLYSIIHDMTDRKKAQAALIESEEKFRSIFESVSEGIILTDKKAQIIYVNDSLCALTGVDRKDLIGKSAIPLAKKMVGMKQFPIVLKSIENAVRQKSIKPYTVNYNDKEFEVSISFNKINNNIVGILRDVTEEKKSAEELKKYRDHLEEEVEKRTLELQHKNEELDNALKVFVGRELIIKNLRNQINELERELRKLKKTSN